MAATPKPVRKYASRFGKEFKKKFPELGMHKDKKTQKSIAKAHAEKDLVTRKGHPKKEKIKSGIWTK